MLTITTGSGFPSGTRTVPVEFTTWHGRVLLLPKLWLRWQLNYLQGTILAIAVFYAHHVGFDVLGNV